MIRSDLVYDYLNRLYPDAKCELNFRNIYQLTISVILSAQTTDIAVNKVTPALFKKFNNFEELAKAKVKEVEAFLKQLGLYKIKASRIIEVSNTIVKDHNGIVPNDLEILTEIKGIGRKTASVILIEGYNLSAFPIDTHIHRISHRLGIAKTSDSIYQVEMKMSKFFKDYDYRKLHHQLIAFGRYHCRARNPNCTNCELSKVCKYYKKVPK
jgi:endonuclease III